MNHDKNFGRNNPYKVKTIATAASIRYTEAIPRLALPVMTINNVVDKNMTSPVIKPFAVLLLRFELLRI